MFAILSMIVSALTGGIGQELAAAYKAHEEAATDQERIAANERIARLTNIAAVQKAEAGNPINAIVRALFALPIAAYYAKIFVIDKVLALGSTDPLSDELTWTARVIISFYFLYEGAMGVTRIAKR